MNTGMHGSQTGCIAGFGLNAFFVMLFVSSALLFRKATRRESEPDAV
jgi:hypothetical protein